MRPKNTRLLLSVAALCAVAANSQAVQDWHDWTESFANTTWYYDNVSSAGTIHGVSAYPGFQGALGPWGMPYAMTGTPFASDEFQIHGLDALGTTVSFAFSNGYAWGTGGEMTIGGIHNGYAYEISAWDFNGAQLDVNLWPTYAEFSASAPGTSGYFSTSWTTRTANGLSSVFSVADLNADANFGQGGEVWVGGLKNIGRIDMTLIASNLVPNAQQVDLMFFNVSTPQAVPEPATLGLLSVGAISAYASKRRARRT